jgi:hypothetical protein
LINTVLHVRFQGEAAGAAAVTAGAAKVASKLAERPAARRRVAKALHPKTDSSDATAES